MRTDLSSFNTAAQLQKLVCETLLSSAELNALSVEFIPENRQDIDYQIKKNLMQQGLVGICMTPTMNYIGHDGASISYDVKGLTLQIVENVPVNRASNKVSCVTGLDVANYVASYLGGPQAAPGFGIFCPTGIEQGEDNGLIVTKCTFDCTIDGGYGGEFQPISGYHIFNPYVTRDDISSLIQLSIDFNAMSAMVSACISSSMNKADLSTVLSVRDDLVEGIEHLHDEVQDVSSHQRYYLPLSGGTLKSDPSSTARGGMTLSPGRVEFTTGLQGSASREIDVYGIHTTRAIGPSYPSERIQYGDYSPFNWIDVNGYGLGQALSVVEQRAIAGSTGHLSVLSDYCTKNETSSAAELCGAFQEISNYVDGIDVAVFGGDKNHDVTYMIPVYKFADALSTINERIGHEPLPENPDIYDIVQNVVDIYGYYGIPSPEIATCGDLLRALNDIVISTELSSDFTFSIKQVLEELNKDFCKQDVDAMLLSAAYDRLELSCEFQKSSHDVISGEVAKLEVALYGGDRDMNVTSALYLKHLGDQIWAADNMLSIPAPADAELTSLIENVREIYEHFGITPPEMEDLPTLFNAVHEIALNTELSSTFKLSMKQAVYDLTDDVTKLNGDVTGLSSKINHLNVPTKLSQLSNDVGFITSVPTASSSTIGGVKINGNNLEILADGTLSAASGGGSGTETDPVFNNWLSGDSSETRPLFIGTRARQQSDSGDRAIAIGNNTTVGFYGVSIGTNITNTSGGITGGSVAIGYGANCSRPYSVCIGPSATCGGASAVSLGNGASISGERGVAIGCRAVASDKCISLGHGAKVESNSNNSIVIGYNCKTGTSHPQSILLGFENTMLSANYFQVYNYLMLDKATGLIPLERLGTGYDASKTQVLKHVNGVATWVDEA